jgi:FkbM family methyltransferase
LTPVLDAFKSTSADIPRSPAPPRCRRLSREEHRDQVVSPFLLAKALGIDRALKSNVYTYQLFRSVVGRIDFLLPLEPDFAAFGVLPTADGILLDVGANDGISARSFRVFNKSTPILSIEANPCHEVALKRTKKALARFDFRLIGAGERRGELVLQTPIFRGIALIAYASMHRADAERRVCEHMPRVAKRLRFVETAVPIVPLDELSITPDFVKIDVEGFEVDVLRGMPHTIARRLPTFMIEWSPPNVSGVLSVFGPLGYRAYAFDQVGLGFRPSERARQPVLPAAGTTATGPFGDVPLRRKA